MNESPTNAEAHAYLKVVASAAGEYAGIPFPLQGTRLVIHPKYRFAEVFNNSDEDVPPDTTQSEPSYWPVNAWTSRRGGKCIIVLRDKEDRRTALIIPAPTSLQFAINTMGLTVAWTLEAEYRALEKLASLLTPHAFNLYVLTGSFVETSPRSGVSYLFRKLRPTLAIRERDGDQTVLCALCLHSIGYYKDSFGGSLVPTDDVISHLLLMRGDEPGFWRLANQHPAWAPQAAV
ncbi:hypothetical protein [Verrucomicrobium sp. BvORR034]|uniref:hypothetical protein n=1 Tax=Verrucomicrobium sp. BvORR034 TaxID=1396418 RepID=UPI00067842DF|nr:hypothetical protein [Verrucomicrobium sp. BvORR034]